MNSPKKVSRNFQKNFPYVPLRHAVFHLNFFFIFQFKNFYISLNLFQILLFIIFFCLKQMAAQLLNNLGRIGIGLAIGASVINTSLYNG